MRFELFIDAQLATTVASKNGIKAYMLAHALTHLFAVAENGSQFNCKLQADRLYMFSA